MSISFMRVYKKLFNKIIEPENLFLAWDKFKQGKVKKIDVLRFEKNLEQNIFELSRDLKDKSYKHKGYTDFFIKDPKLRHIYKATVKDRVLHHAVFQILNPIFEPTFIPTSFSCRISKGNHKGVDVVEQLIRKVSRNYTKPCCALKCDVRKFFDSIDHFLLLSIIRRKVKDSDTLWLIREVVESYASDASMLIGLPIGNLTSQLFANIYMNEFDQHIKQKLKIKYYCRYTDDFIVVSNNRTYLENLIESVNNFLANNLKLSLHPDKVEILNVYESVDFLGYVLRPHHRLMRKRTLNRMFRKLKDKFEQLMNNDITQESFDQSFQSFLGALSHANTHRLREKLQNQYWFRKIEG